MGKQLDFWYQHLAENGVMFITPPKQTWEIIPTWLEMIQTQYNGKIEVQYDDEITEALRIRKLSGAPDHLPLIDNRAGLRNALRARKTQGSGKSVIKDRN